MTTFVTFSGWAQAHDALDGLAPGARHVDYGAFSSMDELYNQLNGTHCDVVIGWSLGGQLALRALAQGALSAKALVLLATPFQFVQNTEIKCGLPHVMFEEFYHSYQQDPAKALQRFSSLVGRNDTHEKDIIRQLKLSSHPAKQWLYWLDELAQFSCANLNFSDAPKTLLIHGREDAIVDVTQTGLFFPFFPGNKVHILDHCGHAPHLHDSKGVKALIDGIL